MAREKEKLNYINGDTNFKNKKLKTLYAKLRGAFDEAARVRNEIVNPALNAFDAAYKTALAESGEVHDDPEYIRVSHRYGLQYAVASEPEPLESHKASERGTGKGRKTGVTV